MMDNKSKGNEETILEDLISLKEASKFSGISHSHLRKLVREGEIAGKRFGRDWFTTLQAVQKYLTCDHRPGPKPE